MAKAARKHIRARRARKTVHDLTTAPLATAPAKIGVPDLTVQMKLSELAELRTILIQAIDALEKLRRRLDGHLPDLSREQLRVAEAMRKHWPPDGRPPAPRLSAQAIADILARDGVQTTRHVVRRVLKALGFK